MYCAKNNNEWMNSGKSACWEMAPREETDGRQRGAVQKTGKKEGSEEKEKSKSSWPRGRHR